MDDERANTLRFGLGRLAPRMPGAGELGLMQAQVGCGKTTALVQLALDELWSGGQVLHLALGQGLDQVQASYDAALLARTADLRATSRDALRAVLASRRAIQALEVRLLTVERLRAALDVAHRHFGLRPTLLVVDHYPFEEVSAAELPPAISGLKAVAGEAGAALWMSASVAFGRPVLLPDSLVDLRVMLDAHGDRVLMHLGAADGAPAIWLRTDTLLPVEPVGGALAPDACTLLSGAARGAEAAFGACAEQLGITERNFTFSGRTTARERGLIFLSPEELRQGDVSLRYVSARMERSYPETVEMRHVLQTIWHQVNQAGEVFAIGVIQDTGKVKGGTGWAVELAKLHHKPVFVFDQERRGWFAWEANAWAPCASPKISRTCFTGTGTRTLSPDGERAIRELFARSFPAKPA